MEPLRHYDLNAVVFILGDLDISAGGEDGAIEFEPGADTFVPKVLVNGRTTVSRTNNESTIATITVGSHTRAARLLDELREEQLAALDADPILASLEFYMRDPSNGDEVKDRFAVFLNKPPANKGAESADLQYRIFLPNADAPGKSPRGSLNP